jgi:hypothetical protein
VPIEKMIVQAAERVPKPFLTPWKIHNYVGAGRFASMSLAALEHDSQFCNRRRRTTTDERM